MAYRRTQNSIMNISATSGKVRKLTNIDQIANGARKNSSVEVSAIMPKNITHAHVTWRA